MPESANNVELFDVIKDPNETTNLVRLWLLQLQQDMINSFHAQHIKDVQGVPKKRVKQSKVIFLTLYVELG